MKKISQSSLMSPRHTLQMTNNRINTVNTPHIKRMSVIIQYSVKARLSEFCYDSYNYFTFCNVNGCFVEYRKKT